MSGPHREKDALHVALSSIGDAVITTDTEGRVTFLNSVAESLTGWTLEEAAGQPIESVCRIIHKESRQPVESPIVRAFRDVALANRILDVSGHVRIRLPSTGPPLGIASSESSVESPVIPLRAGELVLLLSDGVTDASAPCGAAFGWMRAVDTVRYYRNDPAVHIAMNLCHAVRAFAKEAPQLDDITAVVIKVTPDNDAPGREQGEVRHAGIIAEVLKPIRERVSQYPRRW